MISEISQTQTLKIVTRFKKIYTDYGYSAEKTTVIKKLDQKINNN